MGELDIHMQQDESRPLPHNIYKKQRYKDELKYKNFIRKHRRKY